MAITPRTVVRNPLLLAFFSIFALGLLFMFPCGSNSTKCSKAYKRAPIAKQTAVKTVNVATIEAAKSTADGHGWLGVRIETLTPQSAHQAGVSPVKGVLVRDLQIGRPAQVAGMHGYDVITHFNGKRMMSACQLKNTVAATAPGSLVPVRVIREGKPLTIRVTLSSKEGPRGCGNECR